MIVSFPSRRPSAILASALCLASATLLLAPPARAVVQSRRSACPVPSARHPQRDARACGRSARVSKARAHVKGKGHHPKHEIRKAGGQHARHVVRRAKRNRRRAPRPPAIAGQVAGATCEDGTAPVLAGDGSISCQDGSEPVCEDPTGAVFSSDGSFACGAPLANSAGSPAALCADGSAPTLTGEAFFSCQDGSEATCEVGAGAVPSSDGSTLVCQLAGPVERAG